MIRLLLILLLLLGFSCRLDPKYEAPKVDVPLIEINKKDRKKVSEILWQEFFKSDDLKRVIDLALKNNSELKIADLNIELAKKNHAITFGDLLPNISSNASFTKVGLPRSDAFNGFFLDRQYSVNANLLSYELDFFGRLRSLKESALQNYFATSEAQKIVKLSLIADVVDSYMQLVLDQQLIEIVEDESLLYRNRYNLINQRYQNGIGTLNSSLQAKIDYENAKIAYDEYLNIIEVDKNRLLTIISSYDEELLPSEDVSILKIKAREELLDFVVSEALFDRPDVKMAEHNLKSANANIGAARAAFFPSITLSGYYGYTSVELNSLFNDNIWQFSPSINLPIFAGGKNKANLDIAKLNKKVEIINYGDAIQNAFVETRNSLESRKKLAFQTKSYAKILKAKLRLLKLARKNKRYGYVSKIEVLEAKLDYLSARKDYLLAEKDYFMSLVNIYKALGGGKL